MIQERVHSGIRIIASQPSHPVFQTYTLVLKDMSEMNTSAEMNEEYSSGEKSGSGFFSFCNLFFLNANSWRLA
ncbi:hypothetical protein RCL_jg3331.t1 [Rhizophagus clarus]|uniref:Uncharacterized protein n=1 Tax=Rhizophagus clarus TaxID=94130 RepID=A0A8H3M7Y2_9GLOM|nr:hypothetical protein RCL_jg3331.t1 [Rhizophagus clarus]